MMKLRILRDERGATAIETAFALPALIVMMWMIIQMGLVFRAMAGIQHALGEGARRATVWTGTSIKPEDIKSEVQAAVYGIGPGTFNIPLPAKGTNCDDKCLDVKVTYTQKTDLLLLPGPTIAVTRAKRVWLAD
jgi:Flp pilus assembly pilin Flp